MSGSDIHQFRSDRRATVKRLSGALLCAGLVFWGTPGLAIPASEERFTPGSQANYENFQDLEIISLTLAQMFALPNGVSGPTAVGINAFLRVLDQPNFFEGESEPNIAFAFVDNQVGSIFIRFPSPPWGFGTRFLTSVQTQQQQPVEMVLEALKYSDLEPLLQQFLDGQINLVNLQQMITAAAIADGEIHSVLGDENASDFREGFIGVENTTDFDVVVLRSSADAFNFMIDDTKYVTVPISEAARLLIYAGILAFAASPRLRPRRLFGS